MLRETRSPRLLWNDSHVPEGAARREVRHVANGPQHPCGHADALRVRTACSTILSFVNHTRCRSVGASADRSGPCVLDAPDGHVTLSNEER